MHRGLQFFSRIIPATAVLVFCMWMDVISSNVVANDEIIEFSANTIEQIPNRDPISGKLYVAKDKIRIEMAIERKRRIVIRDFSARKTLHLNPAAKEYMEVPWPATKSNQFHSGVRRPPLPGDSDHHCEKFAQLKCKMLNKEGEIYNRKTEKWEIIQEVPNKQIQSGKRVIRSLVWVDRRLGVNIREEMFFDVNSKSLRELRDIKEGPQSEKLFQIPTGYRRVEISAKTETSRTDNMQPAK
uniref:Sigma E regulatory protein, MucB/RseB n=1 Tax=Candidatus Kentrum sp. LFY TaxID=2126342 RepID=A0A450WX81_9GAMM|nr:MAG: hypothetical protein BECKLFY1418C_GA0070996_109810 [Candidatus Kentron sp. LFY]